MRGGCASRCDMNLGLAVATQISDALIEARRRTLELVAPFSDADVETAHSELMSPLVWDLSLIHI